MSNSLNRWAAKRVLPGLGPQRSTDAKSISRAVKGLGILDSSLGPMSVPPGKHGDPNTSAATLAEALVALHMDEPTVKTYVSTILSMFGLHDRRRPWC